MFTESHISPIRCLSATVMLQVTMKLDFLNISTAELQLSGLTGMASHPDMQIIRIIRLFFFS